MAGHAANTDAASIWGTSTATSSIAVSRRSSSDRGGFGTAVHIAQRRAPLPPLHAVHCQSQGACHPGGIWGSWLQRLEGIWLSRWSAMRDPRQPPRRQPHAARLAGPCGSVATPVQLGCHGRPPKPPPHPRHLTTPPRHPFTVMHARYTAPRVVSPSTDDGRGVHSSLSLPLEFAMRCSSG